MLSHKKKIAFFFPSFHVGGVEKVFITYANKLIEDDYYEVLIFVCKKEGELLSLVNTSITVVSLNKRLGLCWLPLLYNLKAYSPDVLIAGPDFPNIVALILVRLFRLKIKLLITQHNYYNIESISLGWYGKLLPLFIRFFYRFSDRVISVSDGITGFLCCHNVPMEKITRIYNPIDIKLINLRAQETTEFELPSKYILFVGRLCPVKNLSLLLDAFELISASYTDLNLVIIGYGELNREYQNKKTNQNVFFLGALSNPYPYISKAELIVLSSFSESFSLVVAEALALGTNIVSTPTLGPMEILENGKYGFIYDEFENPNKFASFIMKAINNPLNSEFLKERALVFDIGYIIKQLKDSF